MSHQHRNDAVSNAGYRIQNQCCLITETDNGVSKLRSIVVDMSRGLQLYDNRIIHVCLQTNLRDLKPILSGMNFTYRASPFLNHFSDFKPS